MSKSKAEKKRGGSKRATHQRERPSQNGASPGNARTTAVDGLQRRDAFCRFAQQRAEGAVLENPVRLSGEERRLHIRQTLREDHAFRIHERPEGAQAKFDKLASSRFKFFRGTALLYYRDQAGTDAHLPVVFCNGDVHPENFGVMPNEDGAPFFGLNDFDESYVAPFSWDVKRGAVGFELAAAEAGLKKKARRAIVRSFVRGYLDGLHEFARDDREKWHQFRLDNSPPLIRNLLQKSRTQRREFLAKMIDLEKSRFLATDEIVPHSSHVDEFQRIIDRYRAENKLPDRGRVERFAVKDVAVKKDSGTASLGLDRFFVLIDGATDDPSDDIVLELKHARTSALAGLTACHFDEDVPGEAARISLSHRVHLVGGDPYYGQTEIDGRSFLVRERSPYKDDIDLDELDGAEWHDYARICGMTVAQAHARSDGDTGAMEGSAEAQILASIDSAVFEDDVVRFARCAAKRIGRDFKLYQRDHALGAFRFTHDPWLH